MGIYKISEQSQRRRFYEQILETELHLQDV